VITNLVTPVDKVVHVILLLGSFLFLPLLAPTYLLAGLAGLFYNLISTYQPQYSFGFQYSLPLLPFLFYASIFGFKRLLNLIIKWRLKFASLSKVAFGFIGTGMIVFIIIFLWSYTYWSFSDYKDMSAYISLTRDIKPVISQDSRIYTLDELQPHFIEYKYAGLLSRSKGLYPSKLEGEFYLVLFVDRTPHQWDEAIYENHVIKLRADFIEVYENEYFLVLKSS